MNKKTAAIYDRIEQTSRRNRYDRITHQMYEQLDQIVDAIPDHIDIPTEVLDMRAAIGILRKEFMPKVEY